MTLSREKLIRSLFAEAADRAIRGEEPDPAMAVVAALCRGDEIPDAELELILRAHTQGPWAVKGAEELAVFARWCDTAGSPLQIGEAVEAEGLRVYVANFGDCCFAEAARGARYAVWTRKGRLHVGFDPLFEVLLKKDGKEVRAEAFAVFRAADPAFTMKATGNKRAAFVVIEGGDTPEMIAKAAIALRKVSSCELAGTEQ
jgi:hypothetical protein